MNKRRLSKALLIGSVQVGGGSPVVVQSMTKTDTRNIKATIEQIQQLEQAGCELIRVAVPDMTAARAIAEIKQHIHIPLIADIHFDHRLALEAVSSGADGLRINPGNIGNRQKVAEVVKAARQKQVPVRIGVNAGSLPPDIEPSLPLAEKMVIAAMREIELLESLGFDLVKVSLKAFDVPSTIEAYRKIAGVTEYPLHLGITEAGTPPAGLIRSTAGLAPLLYEGIGDTIRVSRTASPVEEVEAAWEILKSLNLRRRGPTIISCPTCGRTEFDVTGIAGEIKQRLKGSRQDITIAVMGCAVNGPGEAREADIGIAGGKGNAVLFKHGRKICSIKEEDAVESLMAEIASFKNL